MTSTPRPRRVLVVDDNDDGAAMLAAVLEFDGHEALTASSGPDALALVTTERLDVVLLDLGLPGMDGYEIARRIHDTAGAAAPPLVAITGFGTPEDRARTRAAGFAAHLVKPVDFEALRRALAELP